MFLLACLTVAAIAYCPAALATDPSPDKTSKPKDWYFFISAYGWLAGIDGTIADGGIDEDINVPFIGLRFMSPLSKRWLIALSGDLGGFGIGDAAQFTWQLEGEIGFRVTRWFNLFAEYRALSFDTIEGSGDQRR